MLRVISSMIKLSVDNFMDEIPDDLQPQQDQPEGVIDESNYRDYLTDDIEDDSETQQPPLLPQQQPSSPADDWQQEMPHSNQILGIPPDAQEVGYINARELVYDSIDNREVISFEYTNRHGFYVGLRTVEPHYTFVARSTGNEVLVSFDRDVNDIRAFIVGNIHPNGVRYDGVQFSPRAEIMRGVT